VHDEAEVLEHALSDRLLEAIADQLGHPVRDPHGDPIPSRDGVVVRADAVQLAVARDGQRGRVVRISDRNPELLRYLDAEGVRLDSTVHVVGRRPFGGALAVRIGDSEHDVGNETAAAIWISLD
jgi:DtxR family Mn-dependent transcriptional regulator